MVIGCSMDWRLGHPLLTGPHPANAPAAAEADIDPERVGV